VLNELSTTPLRRMGDWMHTSTFSWPRHWLELSGQLHAQVAFTPGKRSSGAHSIGNWLDAIAGVDDLEKRKLLVLLEFELRPLGLPARSQSLSRLLRVCQCKCYIFSHTQCAFVHQNFRHLCNKFLFEMSGSYPEGTTKSNRSVRVYYWVHFPNVEKKSKEDYEMTYLSVNFYVPFNFWMPE
jgi:hypothetical protein